MATSCKKRPWLFIKDNINANYKHKIYCVRNPRESLPSIVYTENIINESFTYRASNCNIALIDNPLENAIKLLLAWDNKIINQIRPDIIYRIEYDSKMLYDALKSRGLELQKYNNIEERVNQRTHHSFEKMMEEYPNINKDTIKGINDYCERYGYELLF